MSSLNPKNTKKDKLRQNLHTVSNSVSKFVSKKYHCYKTQKNLKKIVV